MYLIFLHSTYDQKKGRKKNGTKTDNEIKEELLKSLIDGEIEFKFG